MSEPVHNNDVKQKSCRSLVALFALILSSVSIALIVLVCIKISYLKVHIYPFKSIEESAMLEKISSVDTRINDIYIWLGFLITLLIGAFALNWSNAKNTAREQAREEFESVLNVYKEDLRKISEGALDAQLNLELIKKTVEEIQKQGGK